MGLEKEFEYYKQNQSDIVDKYNGKYIVIKNNEVIGVYDTQTQAYDETKKNHELGTFLIQYCSPGDTAYTQTFHSLVTFK